METSWTNPPTLFLTVYSGLENLTVLLHAQLSQQSVENGKLHYWALNITTKLSTDIINIHFGACQLWLDVNILLLQKNVSKTTLDRYQNQVFVIGHYPSLYLKFCLFIAIEQAEKFDEDSQTDKFAHGGIQTPDLGSHNHSPEWINVKDHP